MDDFEIPADAIVVRKMIVTDRVALRQHYARLESDALRMRFGATLGTEALDRHVETSFFLGTLLHGCFVDGVLRGVAELRRDGSYSERAGEAAFSVETAWRHHGVATELFRRTLRSARNRGMRTLTISCLAWNQPMRRLAAKFRAEFMIEDGEVTGTIASQAPSSLSLFQEWLLDLESVMSGPQALLGIGVPRAA